MSIEFDSFYYLSDEEKKKLSDVLEQGALRKGLLYHRKRAREKDLITGIPMIEMSSGFEVKGIVLGKNKEYILPRADQKEKFIPTVQNIALLKEKISLGAVDLAFNLYGHPHIQPSLQHTGGVKWIDGIPSPWGDLSVTFNEEVDPEKENVELTVTEPIPGYEGLRIESTTFFAKLHLNGKFDIKEYTGRKVASRALFTDEQDFTLSEDADRLVDKAQAMIDHYLCREE